MKIRKMAVWVLAVALVLSGCGASTAPKENLTTDSSMGRLESGDIFYGGGYVVEDMEAVKETVAASDAGSAGVQSQKLIRTLELEAETEELDALLSALEQKLQMLGGYVENRNVRNGSHYSGRSYRYASLTLRIPVDRLDSFLEHVQGASNVVSLSESARDVTLSYVAAESRRTALETEHARLLELLAQAKNMEDLLTIESRLTDVRTELEETASQLRLYDNLVDYGTVRLSITEVTKFTPVEKETLWQRLSGGFVESLQSLGEGITEVFVFVVVNLPFILVWGLLLTVAVVLIKSAVKKRRRKTANPPEQTP